MASGDTLICKRCDNEWVQKFEKKPKTCPSCKSPFWDKKPSKYWQTMKDLKRDRIPTHK